MAPFKFGKKYSKDKSEKIPISSNRVVSGAVNQIKSDSPANLYQQSPTYRDPQIQMSQINQRVYPTPSASDQRNPSVSSSVSQYFTPWNRIKLAQTPFPRYRHVASSYVTDRNEVIVIGGLHDQSVYGDTWIMTAHENNTKFISRTIDISDKTPPPRVGHASTLCGNAFVIFGGDTHKSNSEGLMDDDVYLFNINSHKWTIPNPVGPRPLGRYGHKISIIATTQMKAKLYVFGGQFDDTYFNDLTVYDLSSFRRPDTHWQFLKPTTFAPPPLTNHVMVSYDYKLWVFGGDTPQGLTNSVYMYNPEKNDWFSIDTKGESPPPLQEHAAVLYKDILCVMGGKDEQDNYLQDVYFLNLKSFKWFKLPYFSNQIPRARSGHSMTLLSNNKLLIMGGDKFDYAKPGDFDMHSAENDMGCGTILYTLDLTRLGEFCPGIYDVVKESPKKLTNMEGSTTPVNSPLQKLQDPPENILTPCQESFQTPQNETQNSFHPQQSQSIQPPKSPIQNNDIPTYNTEIPLSSSSPPSRTFSMTLKNEVSLPTTIEPSENNSLLLNKPAVAAVPEKPLSEINSELVSLEPPSVLQTQTKETLKNNRMMLSTSSNVNYTMLTQLRDELRKLQLDTKKSALEASEKIYSLEQDNNILKENNEKLGATFATIEQLNSIIMIQSQKIEEYESQKDSKDHLSKLQNKYTILLEENNILKRENDKLRLKILEDQKNISQDIKMYSENIKKLITQWKSHEQKSSNQTAEYRNTISNLMMQVGNLTKENKALSLSKVKISEEYQSLKITCDELDKKLKLKYNEFIQIQENYKRSLNSVNNSSRALELSETEIEKLKKENKRITEQLEEMRCKGTSQCTDASFLSSEDSVNSMNDVHYNLKIKDLKAELFIIKQERDSLKDDVLELKKKILNLEDHDSI